MHDKKQSVAIGNDRHTSSRTRDNRFDCKTELGRRRWIRVAKCTLTNEQFVRWKAKFNLKYPPVAPEQPARPGQSSLRNIKVSKPTSGESELTEDVLMKSDDNSAHDGEIDLSFRPVSYSAGERTANMMVAHLTGVERRDAVRNMLRKKPYRQWATFMAREELTEDEAVWAGINRATGPLPTYVITAIEIARIGIHSTLGDEVVIYAVVSDESYEYIIRSSMEEEGGKIVQAFDESDRPLSLGELVDLIDRSFHEGDEYAAGGLMIGNWDAAWDGDAEAAIRFASIDSPYYPTLGDYYQSVAVQWASNHIDASEDEE